jgi:hypothetical protein
MLSLGTKHRLCLFVEIVMTGINVPSMGGQQRATKFNDLLRDATPEQRRWVWARLQEASDADAARRAGVHPATVCRWPNKKQLDEVVAILLNDAIEAARAILADALLEAVQVKVMGLRSRNEPIRQNAATEIIDRVLGKPSQRQEITGDDGGAIIVNIIRRDDNAPIVPGESYVS